MTKTLIIAEKPSVAADIARALGGFTRHDDYFESDSYVLSSAVGHLLEIGMPEEEEVKRGKWTFAHLPAIPPQFDAEADREEREPPEALLRLIKRKDVDRPDQRLRRRPRRRAHLPLHRRSTPKPTKPIQRLWLQSMTPAAIRDGFDDAAHRHAKCGRSPTPPCAAPNPTGSSASTARAR